MKAKILRANSKNLYAFFICLIFTIASIAFNVVYTEEQSGNDLSTVHDYNEAIAKGEDKEGMYVNLTFSSQPYLFASKETDSGKENCYFVYEKNQAFYIIRLTDETYDSITKEYIEKKDNFSYTIRGFLKKTPEDLKKITIEEFNNLFDKKIVDSTNFSNYFGSTYLDQTYTPTYPLTVILAFVSFISGITMIVFLVIYIVSNKTLKGINVDEVEAELFGSDTLEYPKKKLFLTNNYIVSKSSGALKVILYSDIVWMYVQKRYYNGIPIGAFLTVATKNKTHQITVAKNEQELSEIMEVIYKKNGNILLGYTKENIAAYKSKGKQK